MVSLMRRYTVATVFRYNTYIIPKYHGMKKRKLDKIVFQWARNRTCVTEKCVVY